LSTISSVSIRTKNGAKVREKGINTTYSGADYVLLAIIRTSGILTGMGGGGFQPPLLQSEFEGASVENSTLRLRSFSSFFTCRRLPKKQEPEGSDEGV